MKKANVGKFKRLLSLVVVAALFVSAITVSAQAYTLTGVKLEKKLVFKPQNVIGSTSRSHFNEAFWQWNKECNVYSLQVSLTTHSDTRFLGNVTPTEDRIYRIADTSENPTAPGLTKLAFNTTTMKVEHAYINMNVALPLSNGGAKNTYDVWTVFIHEAGHVLGFNHSSLDSVMNVYPIGTIKRYLTQNDINGINYLYK